MRDFVLKILPNFESDVKSVKVRTPKQATSSYSGDTFFFLFLFFFSRLMPPFVCPAVIDVTYLLEEGSGRRLRRRTLGLSDFVSRK